MAQDADPRDEPSRLPRWAFVLQNWAGVALLVVLPLVLAARYQRPSLVGDANFYGYQLIRAGEVGGRWWQIADDPQLGQPYQSEMAKDPSLFEGVDLMWLCAVPSRYLDARQTYYLAACLVLAFNGWVAAWLVWRFSRSTLWAAVAEVLINVELFHRDALYLGHVHLIKYGWSLLGVYLFAEYLREPTRRRGVLLGLALAGALQGSFYLGFLLLLGLGLWWVGCLIARRIDRRHFTPTCLAGLTFALVGAVFTFPVWTTAKSYYFADDYFQRPWTETWLFGAELWQYLVPQDSATAAKFIHEIHGRHFEAYAEGWHFPGYTVLVAVAVYLVARLRGWRLWLERTQVLDVFVGLMGVFVVLSLAGGPSYFLFRVFPSFRMYGRAGLLVLALGCVAGPVILHGALAAVRPRALRWGALLLLPWFVASDTFSARDLHRPELANFLEGPRLYIEGPCELNPGWVDWLARQPSDVRLAAFSPLSPGLAFNRWGMPAMRHRLRHGHATLNGCDFRLFEGDLKLLGASYQQMNPAGLRFIIGLGYERLAFDAHYLEANPWIRSVPWLDWIEERGPWRIARPNASLGRFPEQTLTHLLAEQPKGSAPLAVPPQTRITGTLELPEETVVPRSGRALLAWADSHGKLIGKPENALFQHVFGPNLPAFTIETPKAPGAYDLVFLDSSRRRLASKPYQVIATPRRGPKGVRENVPALFGNAVTEPIEPTGSAPLRIVLENTSPYYLPALVHWSPISRSVQAHPGLVEPELGSVGFGVQVAGPGGRTLQELKLVLPSDLPPHGRLELELPTDHLVPSGERVQVTIAPVFIQCEPRMVAESLADLRLKVTTGPAAPPSSASASVERPLPR